MTTCETLRGTYRRSKVLTARSVMTPPRVYVQPDEGLADLRSKLSAQECESAVVVDREDRFIGTVHLGDVPGNGAAQTSVVSVMRDSCPVVDPGTTLERLIPLALAGDGTIAVLDAGRCIGTISREAAVAGLISNEGEAM